MPSSRGIFLTQGLSPANELVFYLEAQRGHGSIFRMEWGWGSGAPVIYKPETEAVA